MIFCPVEFPSVIGENGTDSQAVLLVKRQHIIVYQSGDVFRLFAGAQEPKGIGAVGIHSDVQN